MELDSVAVGRLVDAEVSQISQTPLAALIGRLRIPPRLEMRAWNYSTAREYLCWLVLVDPSSNVGIAYCAHGFGPKAPWGFLWLKGQRSDMGDDSGWFTSLVDAVKDGWTLPDS